MVNETINWEAEIQKQNDESKNVGWIQFNNAWYYQDENGANKKGWQYIGYEWYYLDSETYAMTTGLREINGQKYFFNDDGSMVKDKIIIADGKKYYCDYDGHMITGNSGDVRDGDLYWATTYANGDFVVNRSFFKYASQASLLNEVRNQCYDYLDMKKNEGAKAYNIYGAYGFKVFESYKNRLKRCYNIDNEIGNQLGMEEEKEAFEELRILDNYRE